MEQKTPHESHEFWLNMTDFYGEDDEYNIDIDITFKTVEPITCSDFYDFCKRAAYAYGFHPEVIERTFI